jgi:DNA polymerase-3 subunit delta
MAAKSTEKTKDSVVLDSIEFLLGNKLPDTPEGYESPSEVVVPRVAFSIGPDEFLRREVIEHLLVLMKFDSLAVTRFDGEEVKWADIHDELATRSLFDTGGPKCAFVRKADDFISKNRDSIEHWIEKGPAGSILLLEVQSLPSNQKIYRSTQKYGWLIGQDKDPSDAYIRKWISGWGKRRHGLKLTADQVNLITDRIGFIGGLVECELAKLALFAGEGGEVSDQRVDELVGGWRTQTVWQLSDWIADGEIAKALGLVDKLVMAGQSPVGIAAQLSWSLRRFGMAAYAFEQAERVQTGKPDFSRVLMDAGFRYGEVDKATRRLRRIGRTRAKKLLSWLVDLEGRLKGSHSQDDRARFALEEFILRLEGDATRVAQNGTQN